MKIFYPFSFDFEEVTHEATVGFWVFDVVHIVSTEFSFSYQESTISSFNIIKLFFLLVNRDENPHRFYLRIYLIKLNDNSFIIPFIFSFLFISLMHNSFILTSKILKIYIINQLPVFIKHNNRSIKIQGGIPTQS